MNMNNDNKIRPMDYVAGVDELLLEIQTDTGEQESTEMLAAFLRRHMRQRGWKRERLAQELDAPPEYINLLLDAVLPASQIDRLMLETIARVFQEDPATIFTFVSRTFYSEDNRDDMIQAKQQLSEYILSEVNNVLFATIDERYADDTANKAVYDQVIGELQRIIARQRRDLRFIESLLKSLENPNLTQMLSQDTIQISAEPDEQTIIYLKKNLERIVKHFGGEPDVHVG